jgi:hypothetical protein
VAQGLAQVRVDGALLAPSPLALKPNEVDAPAASVPLYDTFATTAVEPLDRLASPFQTWLMLCPFGKRQDTVQPLSVDGPLARTLTCAWNCPGHELVTWYVAVQAPAPEFTGDGLGLDGLGLDGLGLDGLGLDGLGLDDGVPEAVGPGMAIRSASMTYGSPSNRPAFWLLISERCAVWVLDNS